MTTMVGIPKDKVEAGLADKGKIEDVEGRQVMSRIIIDRVREFVEDPETDELLNMGRGPGRALPPEKIEEMSKAGFGQSGIWTAVEPADLELYRSYLRPPLSMPEKPEVVLALVDQNPGNPVMRYLEGFIQIKAMCPDGKEGWPLISMPVPTFYHCLEGNCWGMPKYVADEMTVTPTKAEVIYESKVRLSLELTPGPVDESDDALRGRMTVAMANIVSFHPSKSGGCLLRVTGSGGSPPAIPDWQTGMVKVHVMPEEAWAGLIPVGSVSPGFYQRRLGGGGKGSVFQKIKG